MSPSRDENIIRPDAFSRADVEAHAAKSMQYFERAGIVGNVPKPGQLQKLSEMLEAELGREGAKRFAEASVKTYEILEGKSPKLSLWRVIRSQFDVGRAYQKGQPYDLPMFGKDTIRSSADDSGSRVKHSSGAGISLGGPPPKFRKKRD